MVNTTALNERMVRVDCDVIEADADWLTINVRNRFEIGDRMELVTPGKNLQFELTEMTDRNGLWTGAAPGSGHVVRIPRPPSADAASLDRFALLVRYLPPGDTAPALDTAAAPGA